jgi:hypothetical protein
MTLGNMRAVVLPGRCSPNPPFAKLDGRASVNVPEKKRPPQRRSFLIPSYGSLFRRTKLCVATTERKAQANKAQQHQCPGGRLGNAGNWINVTNHRRLKDSKDSFG